MQLGGVLFHAEAGIVFTEGLDVGAFIGHNNPRILLRLPSMEVVCHKRDCVEADTAMLLRADRDLFIRDEPTHKP